MFDVASLSAGTQIVLSSSEDENFPPENMIDGSSETFWVTTGMFPQFFVISFSGKMSVDSAKLVCSGIKHISIEKSTSDDMKHFEPLQEKDVPASDDQLQDVEVDFSSTEAKQLRFIIHSGYDHFVTIHKLSVNGQASR